MATRCGPFSSVQNLNKGTEARLQDLEEKRRQVRKEYRGAIQVAYDQVASGDHVHWEWPDTCEAYGLPEVRKMISDLGLQPVRVAGCMYGVVDPATGKPMRKMWKIYTTSPEMAASLGIRCSGDHEHVACVGGRPAATAYYPPRMARRAVQAMIKESAKHDPVTEIAEAAKLENFPSDESEEQEDENVFAAKELSEKERREIHRHLQSVHTGSGHCSQEALVRALKRKGA